MRRSASPNKIMRANVGGARCLPFRALWAARIAQFRRSAFMKLTRFFGSFIVEAGRKSPLIAVIGLTGCTAAYNTRTVNSPDWKFGATCYVRGAVGRSYLADTKKRIVVSVFALSPDAKDRNEKEKREALTKGVWTGPENPGAIVTATNKLLFRKEYWLRGSDLEWSSSWGPEHDLTITFYDFGAGVEVPYSSQNPASKRVLRVLTYQSDPGLGTYHEVVQQ